MEWYEQLIYTRNDSKALYSVERYNSVLFRKSSALKDVSREKVRPDWRRQYRETLKRRRFWTC